jgi:hypothetical protein
MNHPYTSLHMEARQAKQRLIQVLQDRRGESLVELNTSQLPINRKGQPIDRRCRCRESLLANAKFLAIFGKPSGLRKNPTGPEGI